MCRAFGAHFPALIFPACSNQSLLSLFTVIRVSLGNHIHVSDEDRDNQLSWLNSPETGS
jgi:hypothetical protein